MLIEGEFSVNLSYTETLCLKKLVPVGILGSELS